MVKEEISLVLVYSRGEDKGSIGDVEELREGCEELCFLLLVCGSGLLGCESRCKGFVLLVEGLDHPSADVIRVLENVTEASILPDRHHLTPHGSSRWLSSTLTQAVLMKEEESLEDDLICW